MRYLLTLIFVHTVLASFSQAPQGFEFQGVARNVAGDVLGSQNIALRLSIIQTSAGGAMIYQEKHTPTTNQHGLFTVKVGGGTVLSGTFSSVAWGSNAHFLKVEMDPTGGTTYTDLGTTQLLSVPYAMYASSSNSWGLGGNAATSTDFLGTTNTQALRIKVNNQAAAFISSDAAFQNTTWGFRSLSALTSGTGNSALGYNSLRLNSQGSGNTALGAGALETNTIGHLNTGVGTAALANNNEGLDNVAVGASALGLNTGGNGNVAVGAPSLCANTVGSYNVAIGEEALCANVSGSNSTAVGYRALMNNTASNSTAIGHEALFTTTSNGGCTAVGFHALRLSTGSHNSALGSQALLLNTTGSRNSAFGSDALVNNTTGMNNTAMGNGAATFNTSGGGNTAVGKWANYGTSTGGSNTGVGHQALLNNLTGSNNCAFGVNAGPQAVFPDVSNATSLGYGTITDFSNQIHLGNTLITQIGGYEPWTDLSDIRFKTDVTPQSHGLDFILQLEPITYHIDVRKLNNFLYGAGDTLFTSAGSQEAIGDKEAKQYSGFSAQQVEQAAAAVGYDFNGVYRPQGDHDHYGLAYSTFVVPLVKAVQEQQAMISDLRMENASLKDEMSQLRALVNRVLPATPTAAVRLTP